MDISQIWWNMPKLYIDADGCPVVEESVDIAKAFGIEAVIVCDTSHFFSNDAAQVIFADKGRDASDFVLLRYLKKNDIIVTQDYGLAALALAKQAVCISQNGMYYTQQNIDELLTQRHSSAKDRKHGIHTHHKKRTHEDDDKFCEALELLLSSME